ncbi:hypothetical protein I6A84_12860 [Frankia sp. CNm7]|uniref:Uncharacterized protein n=1 Tax=Frankia nepalensis TaxID=1836974 RepID=A0A937UQU4_9ACTN|nr:hypothetical protein [Frankia nepalensis]MBL7498261.1 hypothetical protein [Frankia nepalensis]MBL7509557.1 hypothetical protein [Frankia nepalensis]MBL7518974.1 hypothetical protein [Frankia nepalensis]MBL7632189.1 hypothetical protein [Frankia nepalensis]
MADRPDAEVRRARELLNTPWRADPEATVVGARQLIELGPAYVAEAVEQIRLHVLTNYRLGMGVRIEGARLLAGLGGKYVTYAAYGLRLMINEYRGYVDLFENMDAAKELAGLGPAYVGEAAWELRRQIRMPDADEWDRGYGALYLADLRGPGVMPEPPWELDFPVYGASQDPVEQRRFEQRWVEGWGTVRGAPDQPLWHLSFGHRTPAGGTLVVSTWRGLGSHWHGPHGPQEAASDAAIDSQVGALGLAFPRDAARGRAEEDFRRAAAPLDDWPRSWPTLTITVNDDRAEFRVRRLGDAWAAVAQLGPLAVGVYGRGCELGDHSLFSASTTYSQPSGGRGSPPLPRSAL